MIIVDTTIYRSFVFIVEDGDKEYEVRCDEGDIYDNWEIKDTKSFDVISNESELGKKLIDICGEDKLMS